MTIYAYNSLFKLNFSRENLIFFSNKSNFWSFSAVLGIKNLKCQKQNWKKKLRFLIFVFVFLLIFLKFFSKNCFQNDLVFYDSQVCLFFVYFLNHNMQNKKLAQ